MYSASFYGTLTNKFSHIPYSINENLGKYSFYGSGGNCDIMFFPKNATDLLELYLACKNFNCFILGNGSDILVSDKGFLGIVINTSSVNKITVKGNYIIAECGAKLADVIKIASYNSLSGLEFAVGIPALIGGAICNNAGCFNKTIGEVVSFVKSALGTFNACDCDFDYRQSRFENDLILSVCFNLKAWDYDTIESKIEHYKKLRIKAPKGKTCGSVFKNEEYFAGKVIDEANLKGKKIGGAKVSEKHANYIINENGTSQDIFDLIKHIKEKVYSLNGISLKEEIKYIGEF